MCGRIWRHCVKSCKLRFEPSSSAESKFTESRWKRSSILMLSINICPLTAPGDITDLVARVFMT
jgi:hypothetical protein